MAAKNFTRKCSVDQCERKYCARGYCQKHYDAERNAGRLLKKPIRLCSIDGCDRKHTGLGYCRLHLERFKAHGDPDTVKHIYRDDDRRFDSYVELIPFSTCHYWVGVLGHFGYGQFSIRGKKTSAHRYAYERSHGSIPKGMHVRHRCDVPCCVAPGHLELGTHQDNMDDMVRRGRQSRGSDVACAKLTENDVLDIRASSGTDTALSKLYGVSNVALGNARKRKTWRHI